MRRAFFAATLLLAGCGGADPSQLFGDAGQNEGIDAAVNDTSVGPPDVVSKDVSVVPDVSVKETGPADSHIQCGPSLACSAQTEICCDHTASLNEWQCVSDVSQCAGTADIPIGCSDHENCVSQGNPSYICCANTVNNTTCTVATDVSCMATCDVAGTQTKVGCGTGDPCPTAAPVCKQSTCTLPGYMICTP